MKLYRAVVIDPDGTEVNIDMYARDLRHATSSANYLKNAQAHLVRVFHNPDW